MAAATVKKSSFVRTKLLEVDCGRLHAQEPYAAVSVLDPDEKNGHGKMMQKKPTFYPNWGQCFDSHISRGRQLGITIYDQPEMFIADVTTEIDSLSEQCRGKPNQITRLSVNQLVWAIHLHDSCRRVRAEGFACICWVRGQNQRTMARDVCGGSCFGCVCSINALCL